MGLFGALINFFEQASWYLLTFTKKYLMESLFFVTWDMLLRDHRQILRESKWIYYFLFRFSIFWWKAKSGDDPYLRPPCTTNAQAHL